MPLMQFETGAVYADSNNALIGYHDYGRLSATTITASSAQVNQPAINVANGNTWQFWQPTAAASQTMVFDLGSAKTVDYFLIASHNFDEELSGDVVFAYSDDNSSYTTAFTLDDADVTDDGVIMVNTVSRSHRYWRFTIPAASADLKIAAIYIGQLLQIEQAVYSSANSPNLTREETLVPSDSEGGQFLGSLLRREWFTASINWEHLEKDWYRTNFDPFAVTSQTWPFGIAWRPDDFSSEVVFARRTGPIAPRNSGPSGLMSVSLQLRAIT